MHALIFLYNTDSTILAQVSDYVRKVLAPDRYECNLCMITYGNFGIKKQWKEYLAKLPHKKTFLHKDELMPDYGMLRNSTPPAVFLRTRDTLSELITAKKMNKFKTLEELIERLDKKLKAD